MGRGAPLWETGLAGEAGFPCLPCHQPALPHAGLHAPPAPRRPVCVVCGPDPGVALSTQPRHFIYLFIYFIFKQSFLW